MKAKLLLAIVIIFSPHYAFGMELEKLSLEQFTRKELATLNDAKIQMVTSEKFLLL
jgi:hypothetical protein